MVGIVIVSHSRNLAQGVLDLAQQMTPETLPLAAAGGIDDPDNPIGTDAMRVLQAIEEAYSDDGVLVLMDLGSALLSAETAVEFLPEEKQAKVRLCSAPLVEGALSAAVQSSVGGSLDAVYEEAMGALGGKLAQLGGVEETSTPTSSVLANALELHLTVPNRLGLHARPAARFVAAANRFAADIRVAKGVQTANAKSINQVATLGARQGDEIVITAVGKDAVDALAAIRTLADGNFGDVDEEQIDTAPLQLPDAAATEGEWNGIPASPGIAIGPVVQYRPRLPKVVTRTVTDSVAEWERLQTAVAVANNEIQALYRQSVQRIGEAEAAIFEAHLLILQDPDLLERIHKALFDKQINAEAAWWQVIGETAQQYRDMADAYMQARAADVLDVGERVLRQMLEVERPSLNFAKPSILVAADLTPSDTAHMNPEKVLGICTERGGATAHSAILARTLGIPAVVGLGDGLAALTDGQMLALDGAAGRIWPDPNYEILADLRAKRQVWLAEQLHAKALGRQPATTKDDHQVEIAANIGGAHDTAVALEYGAEGVGLFRTEFLFLERNSAPTEDEQAAAYAQVAIAMGERPLIIRTLDIGGDKPLPYFKPEPEDNPFLGWRGIRFCLDHPDIFMPQLRAILRASVLADGTPANIKIMFPMIGSVPELQAAKAMLAQAQEALRADGIPFDTNMEVGIMVEVPSAVALADKLAAEVDFFSIGTNDLTQYVMAADRGNTRVADLADALQPAVLRNIQQTVQAGHTAGIWVGMCGELAGSALAAPLLLGLGLDELSMSAPSIPAVKEVIRSMTLAEAQRVASTALTLDTAEEVKGYLAAQKKK
ncbi:MAG: phosphoenolpyruvate--protein phosphotransferase [Ardenticatenaceae bacterium]|nr:phosphoenolpyruvate--protein phosphotransferase [Anaerolineales bacterium]MCB8920373.1 phosphoenolpyruvate--protein phosphotransferase [Ardenticatenaceae bacterium]MCB8989328.1 phosphoenolpyruvate--protein phosphotransferase [Ardenticatenaceae bacterium]